MSNKIFIWFFILTLGLLAFPSEIHACGSKVSNTEESCCKKNGNHAKICCDSKKGNSHNHSGCGGECGNTSCKCNIVSFHAGVTSFIELDANFSLSVKDKLEKKYTQSFVSSAYLTIWLIPKIS